MRAHHIILGIVVVAIGATATSTAHADGVSISLDRVVVAAPGSVVLLASQSLDASLTGSTCTAAYTGQNNGSVHPDNDLIVTSGSSQLVLEGVEDEAGLTTAGSGPLVLAADVNVSVRLGGDGVASLGASLSLTCAPPATTTAPTSVPPATTVAVTATTAPSTTAAVGNTAAGSTTSTTVVLAAGGPTVAPAAASSTPPRNPGLPSTGSSHDQLTSVALAALLVGTLLCLSRRRAAPVAGR
jgi:LPXTG-motif cell wall-anchored protein